MEKLNNRHIVLVIFYLFLFILETPLFGSTGVPSAIIRALYLVLLILPVWAFDKTYIPFAVIISFVIAKFGTAVTYMPTDVWYYIPIFLVPIFSLSKSRNLYDLFPIPVIILGACVLLVDLVKGQAVHDVFFSFFILALLFFYSFTNNRSKLYFELFSYTFIVIGVILSLEILFAGDQYVVSYGYTDLERTMWADPNYLGGVIGMGVMAATILLYNKCTLFEKLFLGSSLMIMVTGLVVNASRGALLAAVCGVLVMFLGKGFKLWQKLFFLAIAAVFIYFLYNHNYFALIEYRLENESGGGSGRSAIWLKKWDAFIDNSNIFEMLFGMGYDKGFKAAFPAGRAFHNDFLAFLVDYGVVGLLAFLSMLYYPLKKKVFNNKMVLGCIVFIIVNCMTLEPYTLGVTVYFYFWLYVYYLSQMNNTNQSPVARLIKK